jgi:competence/damage-inducible protein CinA-like protein
MPVAEIIAIGTELLLGELQDTNTRYMARALREVGIDLYRTTIIGDNAERIAQAIREGMARADIILTTGGLGPTIDDPTRQAAALAIGVPIEFQPELWEQIEQRFQRYGRTATENNRRQAFIPAGSIPIENPVGTAPGFFIETSACIIAAMPGVPREMEYLLHHTILPYLKQKFSLQGTIKAYVLHTAGVGESQIDEWISELEESKNPTVGLLAHAGQVDIRVTAKADSVDEADRMIEQMAATIRERLGDHIFGCNGEKLEDVVSTRLQEHGWQIAALECGLEGVLVGRLASMNASFAGRSVETMDCSISLYSQVESLIEQFDVEVGIGVSLERGSDRQQLQMLIISPIGTFEASRSYGGPPAMANLWAVNLTLDFIRRSIL